jgi:hypothetical protein
MLPQLRCETQPETTGSAAMAALTRFDAAVLIPFYLMMFLLRGGWGKLWSRHVLIASAIAIVARWSGLSGDR